MEAPVRDPEAPPSTQDVAELHLLLSEMDDELTGYRRREAAWVSIVVHALFFLAIIFVPKWIPKSAVIVPLNSPNKDAVFLTESPNHQRVKPPNTNVTSDQNRIAQSRTPRLDKDLLRKLLDASRPGPPAQRPAPQPQQQQAAEPSQPQQQAGTQNAPQPPPPTQQAQLHTPPPGGGPSPFKTTGPGIQHAIDDLSEHHGPAHYRFGGDYGANNLQPNTNMRGDVEIMSDTMGVDFGPYLQRVLYRIKMNWYNLIPEVARPPIMKKGSLIIHFAIMKNGTIQGMGAEISSGDVSLDRAAWGGITSSDPFEHLPTEFPGNYLALRIRFIYNATADELK